MKKRISIMVIIMLTVAFLTVGNTAADAMNNESAALLTAGIVLLGIPVMHAVAHGTPYPEPAYSHTGPARYVEKTNIIYVEPGYKKHRRHRNWDRSYQRGYRQEWKRLERRQGARDARRDYRRGRDYDY